MKRLSHREAARSRARRATAGVPSTRNPYDNLDIRTLRRLHIVDTRSRNLWLAAGLVASVAALLLVGQ